MSIIILWIIYCIKGDCHLKNRSLYLRIKLSFYISVDQSLKKFISNQKHEDEHAWWITLYIIYVCEYVHSNNTYYYYYVYKYKYIKYYVYNIYEHSAIAYNDHFERALSDASLRGERKKKSKFHGVPRTHAVPRAALLVARRRSHRLAAICYSFTPLYYYYYFYSVLLYHTRLKNVQSGRTLSVEWRRE